jgi:tetratricopeptide (TPR) repeat protein
MSTRVDLDELATLEAERTFLLRSLRDLEAEHDAGDVEDDDYVTLRDGYTKRAADVLRQIEAGKASLPPKPPVRWGRRVAIGAAVVAATAGIGWLVADRSSQRLPGQEITGGQPVTERDDVSALMAEARQLFGAGINADAADRYQRVLDIEPDNVVAKTYLAWLLYINTLDQPDELRGVAIEAAKGQLAEAAALDPDYADPHCFLGVIAGNYDGDTETARAESETCIELDPPGQIEEMVQGFIDNLDS